VGLCDCHAILYPPPPQQLFNASTNLYEIWYVQSDSKSLSGFPWPINRHSDNNLEWTYILWHLSPTQRRTS
jgi:hypothetical protein